MATFRRLGHGKSCKPRWLAGFAGREERVGRLEGIVGRILRAQVGNLDLCLIPWTTVNVSVPDLLLMSCIWVGEVADLGVFGWI